VYMRNRNYSRCAEEVMYERRHEVEDER
jgi:hypothetical protein